MNPGDLKALRQKFTDVVPTLNERSLRVYASTEARALGRGGIEVVARILGLARSTIARGLREIRGEVASAGPGRIRRPGGGRKRLVDKDSRLAKDLESLVEPGTRGDPRTRLRWTSKSLRLLAGQLNGMGHSISYRSVGNLLQEAGYSLQANRKTQEGKQHPDRNAQFEHINQRVIRHQRTGVSP